MKISRIPILCVVLVLALAFAAPAFAQQQRQMAQQGVVVKLDDIKDKLSKDLNVEKKIIPNQVIAPLDVAANVCEKSIADLQKSSNAQCTAKTSSRALNQIVTQNLNR